MQGTIGPDVAIAACALRRSHPNVSAREVLNVVMRQRTGALSDFGTAIAPGSDFALIIAAAFDRGMEPAEWRIAMGPEAPPSDRAAMARVWDTYVLPRFSAAYGLT